VDFSNEALGAAEKGYKRLTDAVDRVANLTHSATSDIDVNAWIDRFHQRMNDDLNTPQAIAVLFEAVKWINEIESGKIKISEADLALLGQNLRSFFFDILGFLPEEDGSSDKLDGVMELLLDIRQQAKANKDFATADKIRDHLKSIGIEVMDGKEGSSYKMI
jgi:cysteinyl-tRNA synthetase